MDSRLSSAGLYAIADLELLRARGIELLAYAEQLRAAGVWLVQLRDKSGDPQETLAAAAELRGVFAEGEGVLVMNDRADLGVLAGLDGVHVGQGDLAVDYARLVLERAGSEEACAQLRRKIVGVSTHTEEQVRLAEFTSADYVAIGPVFRTGTKPDAAAVVGIEGVRRARALTSKPLVAIGGITRQNAASVIAAGADAVAVISGLVLEGEPVEKVARDFLALFR